MNLELKPSVFEILPGILTLLLLAISFWDLFDLSRFFSGETSVVIFGSTLVIICSWIIGIFYDSVRNGIFEDFLDRYFGEVNWNFFLDAHEKKSGQLEDRYMVYYSLSFNLMLASFMFLILWIILHLYFLPPYTLLDTLAIAIALISMPVFYFDAKNLRSEIVKFARRKEKRKGNN